MLRSWFAGQWLSGQVRMSRQSRIWEPESQSDKGGSVTVIQRYRTCGWKGGNRAAVNDRAFELYTKFIGKWGWNRMCIPSLVLWCRTLSSKRKYQGLPRCGATGLHPSRGNVFPLSTEAKNRLAVALINPSIFLLHYVSRTYLFCITWTLWPWPTPHHFTLHQQWQLLFYSLLLMCLTVLESTGPQVGEIMQY